jgi:hypothetical protein
MKKDLANPMRLSCLRDTDDPLGVGRMFRQARELPDEELPRLRWHLRTSQRMRAIRPRLFLKVALVVGLVFCMGGVVGAFVSPFWAKKQPAVEDARSAPQPSKRKKARHVPLASETGTESEAKTDEPTPSAAEGEAAPEEAVPTAPGTAKHQPLVDQGRAISAQPTRFPEQPRGMSGHSGTSLAPAKPNPTRLAIHNPAATPTPARVAPAILPAVVPSAIAAEQALLGQAIKSLRDARDPRMALTLLTQHAERFPRGELASEATMVRIEALLALGRRDEALELLDRLPLASLPNRHEQLVVRGELRASHGRWPEARQDFDEAIRTRDLSTANARIRALQERALWGRASARSRLGDQDGARADLLLYLRHFPEGRFAGSASSLVKGSP